MHVVVIVDGTHDTAREFNNLTLIKLPPYSTELKLIKTNMKLDTAALFIQQGVLGYKKIVDEVPKAWNHLISIPARVKKMCDRKWIKLI